MVRDFADDLVRDLSSRVAEVYGDPKFVETVENYKDLRPLILEVARAALADYVIKVMNEALEADPEAIRKLISARVECNEHLAEHPKVQCGLRPFSDVLVDRVTLGEGARDPAEEVTTVGLLGILNGIGGIREDGYGYITAVVEENGEVTRFERTAPVKLCQTCNLPANVHGHGEAGSRESELPVEQRSSHPFVPPETTP